MTWAQCNTKTTVAFILEKACVMFGRYRYGLSEHACATWASTGCVSKAVRFLVKTLA